MKQSSSIHSLIPLEEYKSLLCVDDRDDKLAVFCLVSATFTIEQYCKRKLIRKKHIERVEYIGDLYLPLREYPVNRILAVYLLINQGNGIESGEILEPDFYSVIPDCGNEYDLAFHLSFSHALQRIPGINGIRVTYWAGYTPGVVPSDLASACLELASWNFNRYRGRRIGMTGSVRGSGKDGEHFEMSMPENVKALLEPYRRKVI